MEDLSNEINAIIERVSNFKIEPIFSQTYTGEFLEFMIKEEEKWKDDADSNIFR